MAENTTESNVIYFTRLHWIIFFGPFVGLGLVMAIYIYIIQLREVSLFLGFFALIWILITWVTYHFSSITIKRKQVILRTGIIVRQTVDIP